MDTCAGPFGQNQGSLVGVLANRGQQARLAFGTGGVGVKPALEQSLQSGRIIVFCCQEKVFVRTGNSRINASKNNNLNNILKVLHDLEFG
jgi:hypothetical protein